jgi:hypothetical protein
LRNETLCGIAQSLRTRYVAGNRLAASAVEEERGRSWGGSTERHDEPGSGERTGLEVFLEEGCDEGTFVAPTGSQRSLNLS